MTHSSHCCSTPHCDFHERIPQQFDVHRKMKISFGIPEVEGHVSVNHGQAGRAVLYSREVNIDEWSGVKWSGS